MLAYNRQCQMQRESTECRKQSSCFVEAGFGNIGACEDRHAGALFYLLLPIHLRKGLFNGCSVLQPQANGRI